MTGRGVLDVDVDLVERRGAPQARTSQWYQMWSGGGCQRRCDGETEQLTQEPCKCPADPERRNALAKTGGACKPTTRVNVMLPDLPDLGVWKIESRGYDEANAAEVLAAVRRDRSGLPQVGAAS
jgi:Recombination directionality factor-like